MSDQSQAFKDITKRLSQGIMTPLAVRDANIPTPKPDVKAAAGNKRKSTDREAPDLDDIEIPAGTEIKWNANQLRSKIRTYLSSGEMTVSKFCSAIDVSSNSYYNFMNQSGPNNGIYSDTFDGAAGFFMKREIAGLGMPKKKKAKADDSKSTGSKDALASKKASKDELDVTGITLDGQETDDVAVYDTAQDIRGKINEYLRSSAGTQASLVRALKAQYTNQPSQGLSPVALKTFLSASGHTHGNSSPITYAGYMYFEKLRIKQGKPKSKKREEMETVWGRNGLDLDSDVGRRMIMHVEDRVYTSQYGEMEICRGNKEPGKKRDGLERKWKCYG